MSAIRVIATAYACEPNVGSEPGIGWNIAREVSRFASLVVITRRNNRPAIEAALARAPAPGLRFVYYDVPKWAGWWKRGRRGLQAYYYLWQIGAARLAASLNAEQQFDVAHHITFGRYWTPTFLSRLGIPVVWGPLGGGESTPRGFLSDFPARGRAYEYIRMLARRIGELDPFVRKAASTCAVALATTPETEQRLKRIGASTTRIVGNAALAAAEMKELEAFADLPQGVTRFVSIGRLLTWKGFAMGLAAFATVDRGDAEYWIVGDGPDRLHLETLADSLGLQQAVTFVGEVTRAEALEVLSTSHVLVHPSMHDSGGWVCIEATAAGRPVICLDLGGPAMLVAEETGFRIRADSTSEAVAGIADAMRACVKQPDLVRRLGAAARQRARGSFTWEARAAEIVGAYETALGLKTVPAKQEAVV